MIGMTIREAIKHIDPDVMVRVVMSEEGSFAEYDECFFHDYCSTLTHGGILLDARIEDFYVWQGDEIEDAGIQIWIEPEGDESSKLNALEEKCLAILQGDLDELKRGLSDKGGSKYLASLDDWKMFFGEFDGKVAFAETLLGKKIVYGAYLDPTKEWKVYFKEV